jgi:hypothetical protein
MAVGSSTESCLQLRHMALHAYSADNVALRVKYALFGSRAEHVLLHRFIDLCDVIARSKGNLQVAGSTEHFAVCPVPEIDGDCSNRHIFVRDGLSHITTTKSFVGSVFWESV